MGLVAVQEDIERRVADHNHYDILDIQVSGNTATARAEVRSDRVRLSGVDRTIRFEEIEVNDDQKITRYTTSLASNDPQTAAFQAYNTANPPTPAPVTR